MIRCTPPASITPTSVASGDNTAVGDAAEFKIELDPVNYFGAYFVNTRIFGVPVPVPFEVAANGRAIINVSGFRITTTSLPAAPRGISYSSSLAAENGPPPFTWSVSAGDLPPGLSLSAAGEISGIPTTRGDFSFTVSATDWIGRARVARSDQPRSDTEWYRTFRHDISGGLSCSATGTASRTFTGAATVDVVTGSMTANYSGSDCNGTITGAVAQLTRGN